MLLIKQPSKPSYQFSVYDLECRDSNLMLAKNLADGGHTAIHKG